MTNFNDLKKKLGLSTTLPMGSGGAPSYVTGAHLHGHVHGAGCGCSHAPDEDEQDEENLG